MANTIVDATLRIAHVAGSDPAAFHVIRLRDGKTTPESTLPSPVGFPVESRPNSDLLGELQWYLEAFLNYPFSPETEHADRVLDALRKWGSEAFLALFQDRAASRLFDASTAEDYSALHLQVASDDPRILAWPWEALCDPEVGWIAQTCQIERRLNNVRDPQPIPDSLPKDRVNILLIVARPFGEEDVGFRSIARPLVELIEKECLPAHVELLRPPTFDQLRGHLREHPGYYHILHFDGHGAYGVETHRNGGFTLQAPEGTLIFETEDGDPDPVPAEKLSALLKECATPGVVLNACQSAMLSVDSPDPFASVATALLRSGMRDVVAMAYSLYVSGAQQFLPSFYRGLFEEGSMAKAVRLGRQQMWSHDKRICARGKYPLQDWLVPVLYRQDPIDFSFATKGGEKPDPRRSQLPEEVLQNKDPYGFIGRDSAILAIERAMRRPPAGILIQGLSGAGKTTLARGFLQWLDATGGLGNGCFWLGFQEIRSAEYVINRLGEAIFGGQFAAAPLERRIEILTEALKENRFVIVWDNFESAAGIAGTSVTANLTEVDRQLLGGFLDNLRGGASKVIITSRSTEDWLGPQRRFLLPLGGLDREERWEFCEAILRDLGLTINREDTKLIELMNLLSGHPLAMRAILPFLEKEPAAQILDILRTNLASLSDEGDGALAAIRATLLFVEQSLTEDLRPLLTLVSMNEEYLDVSLMELICQGAGQAFDRAHIECLTYALVSAGLLRHAAGNLFEMHPLLTSSLPSAPTPGGARREERDKWARAFVDVMTMVAERLAPLERQEQRRAFHVYGQNFYRALREAERLALSEHLAVLTQVLGNFAMNAGSLAEASHLYLELAHLAAQFGYRQTESSAFHQLGMIAFEKRDLASAEQRFRRSLAIDEEIGNERSASKTYHHLGMIAREQRDFEAAEQLYLKSLSIKEEFGEEYSAATTYGELGTLSARKLEFSAAEQYLRKSLLVFEQLGKEAELAITYLNLGMVAQEKEPNDLGKAEESYRKSLELYRKLENEDGAGRAYHNLGVVAEKQGDLRAAERLYFKSAEIKERLGNAYGAGFTYHQLGNVTTELEDFAAAEQWYLKSLAISEKLNDQHLMGNTYRSFCRLAFLNGRYLEGGQYSVKSVIAYLNANDAAAASSSTESFMITFKRASAPDQVTLRTMWEKAGLGEFPSKGESK